MLGEAQTDSTSPGFWVPNPKFWCLCDGSLLLLTSGYKYV